MLLQSVCELLRVRVFSAGGVLPQQAQTLSTCPRPLSTVASSSSSSSVVIVVVVGVVVVPRRAVARAVRHYYKHVRALTGVLARAVVCACTRGCCARCPPLLPPLPLCCCWQQWTVDVATVDSGQSLSLLGRRPAPAGQTASLAEVSVNSLISPFKPARKRLHPA